MFTSFGVEGSRGHSLPSVHRGDTARQPAPSTATSSDTGIIGRTWRPSNVFCYCGDFFLVTRSYR